MQTGHASVTMMSGYFEYANNLFIGVWLSKSSCPEVKLLTPYARTNIS